MGTAAEALTVVFLSHVSQLLCLAKVLHEVRETHAVEVSGVVREQCLHQLAEAQVEEEGAAVRTGAGAQFGDLEVCEHSHHLVNS